MNQLFSPRPAPNPGRPVPKVSILLPARNAEETVEAAVRSMLGQSFSDFELVAIDDGSCDGTLAILKRLASADPRMVLLQTAGVGLVGALLLGLRASRGELIARMDADDESRPERLAASLRALHEDPSLAGVGTGVEVFRDDRPPSPNLQAYAHWLSSLTSPELVFRDRLIESPLCHPSVMLRRQALLDVGPWREGDFPEDYDLWLRLLERGHRLSVVPEVLHRWRDHDSRLTRTDRRYAHDAHLTLKASAVAQRWRDVPLTLWGATDVGKGLCLKLAARGVRVARFIELNPRKVGQIIHDVPVVPPDALGEPNEGHLLLCVAAQGARAEIRQWLEPKGYLEGRDFTCLA